MYYGGILSKGATHCSEVKHTFLHIKVENLKHI